LMFPSMDYREIENYFLEFLDLYLKEYNWKTKNRILRFTPWRNDCIASPIPAKG
jgi:hypothetical protein